MTERPIIPLAPVLIELADPKFAAICLWSFADPFVARLLREDVPQRVKFNHCRIWIYLDPQNEIVGFGTLDFCDDYRQLTNNLIHPYIPILAVHPDKQNLGHGKTIVGHLIMEAALVACFTKDCHDALFLEAYTSSVNAIKLYRRCGFECISDTPYFDSKEEKEYLVMVRRVSLAGLTDK